ncbi:MAG: SDR family oxidoreductase [Gemmataceae bacterium]|nr:SDR family oxidoreductase [Gemmataceae bacterium]
MVGKAVATHLITGGAGFIGSHLADALVTAGETVRILDDLSTGRRDNLSEVDGRIEMLTGCVTDQGVVATAVKGVDTVFHLAALPSVQRSVEAPYPTHEVCARGTLEVLEACRRSGVRRVVYAASSSAYGDTPGTVRLESDPVAPLSPYAAAKLAGEHYCRAFTTTYGLETVRLRFFNIFGPRQRADSPYSGVIPRFTAMMAEGRRPTIFGDGRQSRDFTFVSNAVQALQLAAEAPAASGNVYNVGAGANTSLLDLVRHLNELLGTDIEPVFAETRAGDVRHSRADIARAQQDLGYRPTVSFPKGLERTLDAYRVLATAP